jgi:folate-binding protein YgfZ
MRTDWNLIELGDWGVLRVRGADAVRFLQGQVSNDVQRLTGERSQLAGYHNPQGRAVALMRLVQLEPDDLLAILPRELTATVASRLSKFVLRAKVKIADESGGWRLRGLVAPFGAPASAGGAARRSAVAGGAGVSAAAGPSVVAGGAGASGAAGPSVVAGGAGASGAAGPSVVAGGAGASGALGSGAAAVGTDGTNISAAFEARAMSWAAAQFEEARAKAAAAGEESSAAAQLEVAESVVPLPTASALMLPDGVHMQSRSGATIIVRVGETPARWLVISPAGDAVPLSGCVPAERDAWRLLDIADGEPQVYAATSEEFVAQMLNLDALDAIAFDKGCYTGQEVIARAHYRGRVKRRLQRFVSRGPAKLAIGESGQLVDGRTFKVVEAVQLANGRCEFLAVAPMVAGGAAVEGSGAGGQAAAQDAVRRLDTEESAGLAVAEVSRSTAAVDAEALPLPYPLPE